MRRVSWLRIVVDGDRTTCEAVGLGHRLPTVRPVTMTTATQLAADRVPVVVKHVAAPSPG